MKGYEKNNITNLHKTKGGFMESIKTKIKAIIFDMDGTILKTEHIWQQVTIGTLEKYGITELSKEQEAVLLRLSGMGMKEAATLIKNEFNLPSSIEEIFTLKLALANMHFESALEYIDGFETFHKLLITHNIPTGLATNAHPHNLSEITKTMNLKEKFGDHIYCIAHVNFVAKPSPALFLHTAEKLGVKPEECLVFEDSVPGFKAAKAAGMKCIAIRNPYNRELFKEFTDHGIDSYDEAIETIKKLFNIS